MIKSFCFFVGFLFGLSMFFSPIADAYNYLLVEGGNMHVRDSQTSRLEERVFSRLLGNGVEFSEINFSESKNAKSCGAGVGRYSYKFNASFELVTRCELDFSVRTDVRYEDKDFVSVIRHIEVGQGVGLNFKKYLGRHDNFWRPYIGAGVQASKVRVYFTSDEKVNGLPVELGTSKKFLIPYLLTGSELRLSKNSDLYFGSRFWVVSRERKDWPAEFFIGLKTRL
jgi:opacity protein-like surface antigen